MAIQNPVIFFHAFALPVPSNGILNIETTEGPSLVKVYNAVGKVVKMETLNASKSKIDISGNNPGIYFEKVQNSIQNTEQKIVL